MAFMLLGKLAEIGNYALFYVFYQASHVVELALDFLHSLFAAYFVLVDGGDYCVDCVI